MVDLAAITAARTRIAPHIVTTPLERSVLLSDITERDVWLKLECFQVTGSFKLRGALNALSLLTERERQRGVMTASAGNHGLGVAKAGQIHGVQVTVVVPETASPAKIEILEHSGASLMLHGQTYDDTESFARSFADEQGKPFISPYNDPAVIAGGGTIALEVFDQLPTTKTLVVPAGGGGLISGIGVAAHGVSSTSTVYGAQSDASPALSAALKAKRLVPVEVQDSLADGLSGNVEHGSITLQLLLDHVKDVAVVTEPEIAAAMRYLLEREHMLVEGSGAVGVAALRRGLLDLSTDGPVVLILTGRNVAPAILRQFVYTAPTTA